MRHATAIKQAERVVRRVTDGPTAKSTTLGGRAARRARAGEQAEAAGEQAEAAGEQAEAAGEQADGASGGSGDGPCPATLASLLAAGTCASSSTTTTTTTGSGRRGGAGAHLSFECSHATGRVHVYLSDDATAADRAAPEGDGPWWLYHESFSHDDLPLTTGAEATGQCTPVEAGEGDTRASDNPTAICLARLKEICHVATWQAAARPILAEAACAFWAQWRALSVHGRRRLRGRPLELVHLADEGVGGGGSAGVGDGGANGDGGEVGLSGGVGCGAALSDSLAKRRCVGSRRAGLGGAEEEENEDDDFDVDEDEDEDEGDGVGVGVGGGGGGRAAREVGGGVHIGDGHAASPFSTPRSVRSIHAVGSVGSVGPISPSGSASSPESFGSSSAGATPSRGGGGSRGGSTRRARPRMEPDPGAPEGVSWGVAMLRLGRRGSYAMPLAVSPSGSHALCLACYAPLHQLPTGFEHGPCAQGGEPGAPLPQGACAQGGERGAPLPGPTASPLSDTELFCGGACRATYAGRRCRGSLRQQVARLDGASCAQCGLDAPSLCQQLAEAPPGQLREAILGRLAPAIAAEPRLAARLLEAPHVAGNAWHADHRTAVFEGGGECTVENMQVLCVACHKQKTRREASERAQRRRDERRDAVAAAAIAAAGAATGAAQGMRGADAASAGRAPARQSSRQSARRASGKGTAEAQRPPEAPIQVQDMIEHGKSRRVARKRSAYFVRDV